MRGRDCDGLTVILAGDQPGRNLVDVAVGVAIGRGQPCRDRSPGECAARSVGAVEEHPLGVRAGHPLLPSPTRDARGALIFGWSRGFVGFSIASTGGFESATSFPDVKGPAAEGLATGPMTGCQVELAILVPANPGEPAMVGAARAPGSLG